MSKFKVGDTVRIIERDEDYFNKVTTVTEVYEGEIRVEGVVGLFYDEHLELVVTPKVGDHIRATRGETVISATVDRIVSSSYVAGGNDICVQLDGKPDQFFWVNDGGGFTVEIIKPKVILPTKVGAIVRFEGKKNYIRVSTEEYGSWFSQAKNKVLDDWHFNRAIAGDDLEVLSEGVDIP